MTWGSTKIIRIPLHFTTQYQIIRDIRAIAMLTFLTPSTVVA